MQTHKKDIVWPEAGVVRKGAGARDETEGVGVGGGRRRKHFCCCLLSTLPLLYPASRSLQHFPPASTAGVDDLAPVAFDFAVVQAAHQHGNYCQRWNIRAQKLCVSPCRSLPGARRHFKQLLLPHKHEGAVANGPALFM